MKPGFLYARLPFFPVAMGSIFLIPGPSLGIAAFCLGGRRWDVVFWMPALYELTGLMIMSAVMIFPITGAVYLLGGALIVRGMKDRSAEPGAWAGFALLLLHWAWCLAVSIGWMTHSGVL